jgi:hypothetical protein
MVGFPYIWIASTFVNDKIWCHPTVCSPTGKGTSTFIKNSLVGCCENGLFKDRPLLYDISRLALNQVESWHFKDGLLKCQLINYICWTLISSFLNQVLFPSIKSTLLPNPAQQLTKNFRSQYFCTSSKTKSNFQFLIFNDFYFTSFSNLLPLWKIST